MKRVALFAHYDAQAEIKPYILFFLKALSEVCEEVVFVSAASLPDSELERVRSFCSRAVLRGNIGYDFGMWQHALANLNLADVDELVLTNSSIFGPIYPLAPIFSRMAQDPCEFWAMTDNFEIDWHLQSYFLVFKRVVLSSPAFAEFFRAVLPYRDKEHLIRCYEVGLTKFLCEQGFRAAAFAPSSKPSKAEARGVSGRRNPTLFRPAELLAAHMPFVKVHLLRDNPGGVALAPILRRMQESGYEMSNVRFDRCVSAPKTLRDRVRRWLRPYLSELHASKT